jgi:hypothetical protein
VLFAVRTDALTAVRAAVLAAALTAVLFAVRPQALTAVLAALTAVLSAVRTDALTAVRAAILAAAFNAVLFAGQPLVLTAVWGAITITPDTLVVGQTTALTAVLIASLLILTAICTTALEARTFTIQMPVNSCKSDLHPTYRTGHQLKKRQKYKESSQVHMLVQDINAYLKIAVLRIRNNMMRIQILLFSLIRIWIRLFTSMRTRIRNILLINVMQISEHWSTGPPRLNCNFL